MFEIVYTGIPNIIHQTKSLTFIPLQNIVPPPELKEPEADDVQSVHIP